MENEVDEEIYKILHTNFDSIQKDDDEVKSNKISVISESRNSKSIQMNPNKYCKNNFFSFIIGHEISNRSILIFFSYNLIIFQIKYLKL